MHVCAFLNDESNFLSCEFFLCAYSHLGSPLTTEGGAGAGGRNAGEASDAQPIHVFSGHPRGERNYLTQILYSLGTNSRR